MRAATWRLMLLLLAATLAPAVSAAARSPRRAPRPALRLLVRPVPVTGWPSTGNRPRAGASLELQIAVVHRAREAPTAPVTEVKLYLPTGLAIRSGGFPACWPSELLVQSSCPPASRAGPPGEALLSFPPGVPIATEPTVAEAFHGPGGGLELVVRSSPTGAPALLGTGTLHALNEGGYGPVVDWRLSAPAGLPMPTLDALHLRLGSAFRTRAPESTVAKPVSRPVYYFTLPGEAQCPLDGLHFAAVVRFAATRRARAFTIEGRDRPPCPPPRTRSVGAAARVG